MAITTDRTSVTHQLTEAYATNQLSDVLEVLDQHAAGFRNLERAKVHFAVQFLHQTQNTNPGETLDGCKAFFQSPERSKPAILGLLKATEGAPVEDLSRRVEGLLETMAFKPETHGFVRAGASAAAAEPQTQSVLQQQMSIAYETGKLSMVLKVLITHAKELTNLEEAKIEFAIGFLGYIKSKDPAAEIRKNAGFFDNVEAAEAKVRKHFPTIYQVEDLVDQVAGIRADGRTFSAENLAFVAREDDAGDAPSPQPSRSRGLMERVRAGQFGKKS
ncbi:MAG: hypothetical protein P0S96_08395 [Simkaniaceae bacterium]|nr:hypothetical protein [Candidatus Sacchlamyda saccharinae]